MNPNIMSAASVPEPFLESVVTESAWEAVVRVSLRHILLPLTNTPTDGQISILDKSRLIWGGLGAVVAAPRCVRSIARLISAIQTACDATLNSPESFRKQVSWLHSPSRRLIIYASFLFRSILSILFKGSSNVRMCFTQFARRFLSTMLR